MQFYIFKKYLNNKSILKFKEDANELISDFINLDEFNITKIQNEDQGPANLTNLQIRLEYKIWENLKKINSNFKIQEHSLETRKISIWAKAKVAFKVWRYRLLFCDPTQNNKWVVVAKLQFGLDIFRLRKWSNYTDNFVNRLTHSNLSQSYTSIRDNSEIDLPPTTTGNILKKILIIRAQDRVPPQWEKNKAYSVTIYTDATYPSFHKKKGKISIRTAWIVLKRCFYNEFTHKNEHTESIFNIVGHFKKVDTFNKLIAAKLKPVTDFYTHVKVVGDLEKGIVNLTEEFSYCTAIYCTDTFHFIRSIHNTIFGLLSNDKNYSRKEIRKIATNFTNEFKKLTRKRLTTVRIMEEYLIEGLWNYYCKMTGVKAEISNNKKLKEIKKVLSTFTRSEFSKVMKNLLAFKNTIVNKIKSLIEWKQYFMIQKKMKHQTGGHSLIRILQHAQLSSAKKLDQNYQVVYNFSNQKSNIIETETITYKSGSKGLLKTKMLEGYFINYSLDNTIH